MHENTGKIGYCKWPEAQKHGRYVTRVVHNKGKKGDRYRGQRHCGNQQRRKGYYTCGVYRARHRMEGQEISGNTICISYMKPHEQRYNNGELTTEVIISSHLFLGFPLLQK